MNLAEFRRRLMTDPDSCRDERRSARLEGGERAELAEESDRFEAALGKALRVDPPPGLAEQVILRQSLEGGMATGSHRGRWRGLVALAAVLALAVALTTYTLVDSPGPHGSIDEHLAWHWQYDGPRALAMARSGPATSPDRVDQIMAELGLQLEPELAGQVRLTKFCPTPDGAGAHMILDSPDGPVTLFYMPRTQIASSPQTFELPDGMQAHALNVERGSIALIAATGADMPGLAREIARQLSFPPGMTL